MNVLNTMKSRIAGNCTALREPLEEPVTPEGFGGSGEQITVYLRTTATRTLLSRTACGCPR
jgi:hypothetical protein